MKSPKRKCCEGKIKHATMLSAQSHADSLTRKKRIEYVSYSCPFCYGFHAGRPRNKEVAKKEFAKTRTKKKRRQVRQPHFIHKCISQTAA
jgi:hypothetical protein